MEPIARQAMATGGDPEALAQAIADRLISPDLKLAFVFADHRLPPAPFAAIQRATSAPVVGCSAVGVIGPGAASARAPAVVGLGLYGDWLRVGVGVAESLSSGALAKSREAVRQAAAELGTTEDALDPGRHVAISLFDGLGRHVEEFCIGSAATVPKLRFLGAGSSTELTASIDELGAARPTHVWARGEARLDAGIVIVLDSDQPFHAVTSSHLVASEPRTVVTQVRGRVIEQLDGRPAATRLRQLVAQLGDQLDEVHPTHAFARYIDGVPYVRSIYRIDGEQLILASAVEPGHVLRVMRPGDLLRTTQRDLATAAERVGGTMAAFLAFSCMARHTEVVARAGERELAATYAGYPVVGFHTVSEQSGMLLVNHTLTGLAIGAVKP